MPDNTLRIIARIKAKPDKVEETRELLSRLVEPTRKEAGCLGYELLQNRDDPTEFTFVEEWRDEAAIAGHFETEHIKGALQKFPELAAEPLDLRKYTLVG